MGYERAAVAGGMGCTVNTKPKNNKPTGVSSKKNPPNKHSANPTAYGRYVRLAHLRVIFAENSHSDRTGRLLSGDCCRATLTDTERRGIIKKAAFTFTFEST